MQEKGNEIYVLTRKDKVGFGQVHFIKGDIADADLLKKMMSVIRPDTLVHLAWNVKDEFYASSDENRNWVYWSRNLADRFLGAGGKVVVAAGTCFEYDLTSKKPLDESSPCKPNTLYGRCKLEVRQLLQEKCELAGARFVWGRIFYPYGLDEEERKLFSSAINSLKQEKAFTCRAENMLDYIHKIDVSGMFVEFVENDCLVGDYNVGSRKGYKVRDLITLIAKKMGKEHLVAFKACETRQMIVSDNRKILSVPYKLQYNMEKGLEQMIEGSKVNEVPAL